MRTRVIIFLMVCFQTVNAQFSKIYDFKGEPDLKGSSYAQPVFDGTYLYEMTSGGGQYNEGSIFRIKPDGSSFSILHSFDSINGGTPYGSLLLSGTVLYGMTNKGGSYNYGCIFRMNTDGSGYKKLLDFDGLEKGASPYGGLILSDTMLYGMTSVGGSAWLGCVFKISINGNSYTNLYSFLASSNASHPYGSLTKFGDTLFGITNYGSATNRGALFKIKTDGTNFVKLWDLLINSYPTGSLVLRDSMLYGMCYGGSTYGYGYIFKLKVNNSVYGTVLDFNGTNRGAYPYGNLTISDSTMYGMTYAGGTDNNGCVFKVKLNGSGFTKIHDFSSPELINPYGSLCLHDTTLYGMTFNGGIGHTGGMFKINVGGTGYDKVIEFRQPVQGRASYSPLVQSGDMLYGMSYAGGAYGLGCIYKIKSDGTGYTKLLDFKGADNGATPYGGLTLSGSTLFGMTYSGGAKDSGCIFKVRADGTGFSKLFDFSRTKGGHPYGSLTLVGNMLYGFTEQGGSSNYGCAFKIDTSGNNYSTLVEFNAGSKGAYPHGTPLIAGGTLFGTASSGGSNSVGTLFKVATNGSNFTTLLNFNIATTGSNPYGKLVLCGSRLYGMASTGGTNSLGCIFKIDTTGLNFKNLFSFESTVKGNYPNGSLLLVDNVFYCLASGGVNNDGCIFKIDTTGANYTVLKSLRTDTTGGDVSYAQLLNYNNSLYAVAPYGGVHSNGTIFKYVLTPTIQTTNIINTSSTSVLKTFSWTKGNGYKRVVFIKEGTGAITNPANNITYTASNNWNSKGTQLGSSGYFCVYNGDGDSVSLTNMPGGLDYTLQVFEYNGTSGIEQYLTTTTTGNPATIHIKTDPEITWNSPSDITYGTLLSATQLNATANTAGTFVYTPALNTKLNAGNNQSLGVEFTPTDAVNYNTALKTVTINVAKVSPEITWNNPADITYGTLLSAAQLNATASTDGTFVYNPALDTKLNAGSNQSLQVEFTPTDAVNYNSASRAVNINVSKANTEITWNNPSDITYGTLLDNTQLNAIANVAGAFVYTPASGTKLNAGNGQSLSTDFTPADAANYNTSSKTVAINVAKANPVITWSNPADITYGTALSNTQLNATANVDGTFVYTPALGTALNIGSSQSLNADFTPTDTANYNTATKTVAINVLNTTGITITEESSIALYPNPVKDKLFIRCTERMVSLCIIALSGLEHICITGNNKESEMDLSALPEGIYVLKVLTSTKPAYYKIIKN